MTGTRVRCNRCAEIVDSALPTCPRCGVRLKVAPPAVPAGSFAERYGQVGPYGQAAPDPLPASAGSSPSRLSPRLLIASGTVLLVAVLAATILFDPFSSPSTPPEIVVPAIPASPTPTLPAPAFRALGTLNDPAFSATIVADGRLTLDRAFNNGVTRNVVVHLEATVSGGNEAGRLTVGSTTTEFRSVGGAQYSRVASGRWKAQALPEYLQLLPLFGLTDARMLEPVGAESRDGWAVLHLRSTSQWAPDAARLALLDLSSITLKPERTALDLWVEPDGLPLDATFSASVDTSDGSRHLLYIETTYTFRDVGLPVPITAPK